MIEQHFRDYQAHANTGQKKLARAAIERFCGSFSSHTDKEIWVRANIAGLHTNRSSRIRHELYEQVVFPVLLAGFEQNDAFCLHWLGRTVQNLYASQHLHQKVGGLHQTEYHERAFAADPETNEIRHFLLGSMLNEFDYIDHEWPAGLLIGPSSKENCDTFHARIEFARSLDAEQTYESRLHQLAARLDEYRSRSNKD